VPIRAVALDRRAHVSIWATVRTCGDVDAEILVWIAAHVNNRKRPSGALAGAAALFGVVAASGRRSSPLSISCLEPTGAVHCVARIFSDRHPDVDICM
jgi:hypothetical protein